MSRYKIVTDNLFYKDGYVRIPCVLNNRLHPKVPKDDLENFDYYKVTVLKPDLVNEKWDVEYTFHIPVKKFVTLLKQEKYQSYISNCRRDCLTMWFPSDLQQFLFKK